MQKNGRNGDAPKYVTVQPAPFVKPHFALIAAVAAVLLINGRPTQMAELLQKIPGGGVKS